MKKITVKEGPGIQRGTDAYDLAMERFLARKPRKLSWVDGRRPKRDELYDRPVLRRFRTPEE